MGNYFESIKKDVQSAIEKAMEDIFEQYRRAYEGKRSDVC